MKFTQIPTDAFESIQMNAGILVDTFTPATGTIGNLIGATTGGITFNANNDYQDFGDDIDNCPKNMKELKKQTKVEATLSGTFVTVTASTAKRLIGAADIDSSNATHIVPRNDIAESDFKNIWWIGDYSNLNGEQNGGFCAIHLINALSTGGLQIKSTDKAKGQFAFTFLGHYSMDEPNKVPYEVYVKAGSAES